MTLDYCEVCEDETEFEALGQGRVKCLRCGSIYADLIAHTDPDKLITNLPIYDWCADLFDATIS